MGRTRGVGVSKGCQTCRHRKIKCDERHPLCLKCEKAHIVCGGYIREHRFVDEVARTVKHVQKVKTRDTKRSTAACPSSIDSEPPTPKTVVKQSNSSSGDTQAFNFDTTPLLDEYQTYDWDLRIGRHIPIKLDENMQISYLSTHLFAGVSVSIPWLHFQASDHISASAIPSVRALAAVYFGRRNNLPDVVEEGFRLYGQALRSLNADLLHSEDDRAWSITILRSAVVLEYYELIAFESMLGWLKHAGGVGRLIELRGPERHQSPSDRDLLDGNRRIIALGCVVKRKRCFLEIEQWKTVPWAHEHNSKTSLNYLDDILCDIPGLLEDSDELERSELLPEQRVMDRRRLSDDINLHLQQLYAWREKWAQLNPEACNEVPSLEQTPPSSDSKRQSEPLFPAVFHYSSLTAANEITSYNAILLLLLRLARQVIGPSFRTSYSTTNLRPASTQSPLQPPGTANTLTAAKEICKSVKFHLNCGDSAGAFFMLFPLRWQAFGDGTREKKCCEAVIGKIADKSGWEIGRGPKRDSMRHEGRILEESEISDYT
ncbi:Uncharacterized protein LSUE1_G007601 [Lachnellula suecica]|uniref:Zn(2)-C6 fungal-type domain-containing protein n=1 Tax=Lachnellula suecica TaxID=602035 RepID=A0A8T9BYY1_9HELO|nr:Uncharacterized protein LSUE1_G007601 [Lachnellula suecica]